MLETIAEVSVAFAGFAGIVSVFGRSRIDPEVRMWRIRLMIVTSLITLFLALLPAMLLESGLDPSESWQRGCLLLGVGLAAQLMLTYYWMPPSYRAAIFPGNRMALLLTTSSTVGAFAELAVGFEVVSLGASAAYSWGLLYLLFVSAYHFFRLIVAVQLSDEPA